MKSDLNRFIQIESNISPDSLSEANSHLFVRECILCKDFRNVNKCWYSHLNPKE